MTTEKRAGYLASKYRGFNYKSVRIPVELFERLKPLAEADDRSVNSLVVVLLKRAITEEK